MGGERLVTELAGRRRAAAAGRGAPKVWEWDYTEGLGGKLSAVLTGGAVAELRSNGLYLNGAADGTASLVADMPDYDRSSFIVFTIGAHHTAQCNQTFYPATLLTNSMTFARFYNVDRTMVGNGTKSFLTSSDWSHSSPGTTSIGLKFDKATNQMTVYTNGVSSYMWSISPVNGRSRFTVFSAPDANSEITITHIKAMWADAFDF